MQWAYNNPQAVMEYWAWSSHVTALASQAIVAKYYEKTPQRSYFMGCSGGGIQALWEAERFPWDYDGVVAGAPALGLSGNWMNLLWANRAFTASDGKPLLERKDLELLHKAVVAKCDKNDGIEDGLIGDPRQCQFNPTELRCSNGATTSCLTDEKIAAIDKVYRGPVTSKGYQIVQPSALPGSELNWYDWFVGSDRRPTQMYKYIGAWFQYYMLQPNPGPTWQVKSFDFDRDYRRLGISESSEPINSPDLRRFKRRGGKLIMYSGWSDTVEGVLRTVDFYETAEKIIGTRKATQDFFRLFVAPGVNHCGGGDGAYAVDYLSYLESWVERGHAPERVIGAHLKPSGFEANGLPKFPIRPSDITFSRPVYPYPTNTRYMGHGNPNSADSFGPAD